MRPAMATTQPGIGRLLRLRAAERAGRVPFVSVVVPAYNEENTVDALCQRVEAVLQAEGLPHEVLFVNDGSSDATFDRLLDLALANPRCRVINLSRNFGKEAAITAGLDHARGEVLVVIDADLQHPPEVIPAFIERWRAGYDVVYGARVSRESETLARRFSADWFYRLFNSFSRIKIPENAGDFRLLDRRVAEVLRRLPEKNRFMKGLFAWAGFPAVGVPYIQEERRSTRSTFSFWKLWNFALDGLFAFSTVPLRVWSYVGGVLALAALVYMSQIILQVLMFGKDTPGYASLLTVVLFLGGIQLLTLGILGEYVGRLFTEVKNRPTYVVEGEHSAEAKRRAENAPRG
jgi:glycosyltransferase involved in cell wall biosynthesis